MEVERPKGKLIGFKTIDEGWTLIKLDDGNYLRIKPVVTKILKTNKTEPDGTPIYWIRSTTVVAVLTVDEVQKLYRDDLR